MSHVLIVNPSAGAGRAAKILPEIEASLERAGLTHRTVMTTGMEHGCAAALEAARAGELPVVVSGDGLIGQIGGALAGGETPLAIVPGGRGNDFARVVGIPTEIDAAVAAVAAGKTRQIDVGQANAQRFLCIASCGFDSDANRIANEAKWIKGQAVYAYAALRALAAWKPATFTLTIDGDKHTLTGYSVAAANSKAYGGGMMIAPDAELDDGLIDVVSTAKVSKLRFLRGLPDVFDGSHVERPEVSVWRGREVLIEADRPFAVYADGDHVTDLPATISVLPRALSVVVP